MKTAITFAAAVFCMSALTFCNERGDENLVTDMHPLSIDSVRIAQDTMKIFTVQPIYTYSDYRASCEGFYGYDYRYIAEFARDVTAYQFTTNAACGVSVLRASQINFRPQQPGTYRFRFWNGGNNWLERQIVVIP